MKKSQPFENLVKTYLDALAAAPKQRHDHNHELEVHFGTVSKAGQQYKSIHPISKTDYDKTIRQLFANGFRPLNDDFNGTQMLRIYGEEFPDYRLELVGIEVIRDYCKTNDIAALLQMPEHTTPTPSPAFPVKIRITQKKSPEGEQFRPVDIHEHNFRLSLKTEADTPLYNTASAAANPTLQKLVRTWKQQRKFFRFIKRIRFAHPTHPVFADLSIIQSSTARTYTLQESGTLQKEYKYEIELEADNARVRQTPGILPTALRQCVRVVASALQDTNYPVSYAEQDGVLYEYATLLYKSRGEAGPPPNLEINANLFFGPSSKTLQLRNLTAAGEPNITQGYTATDKADGERKLLYVASTGRIYLIDTNMRVSYTGLTAKPGLKHTLIDGEYILLPEAAPMFACFDIYHLKGQLTASLPFTKTEETAAKKDDAFRLFLLWQTLREMDTVAAENDECRLRIQCKKFYGNGPPFETHIEAYTSVPTIFDGCRAILQPVARAQVYATDGLIMTAAASPIPPTQGNRWKLTWEASFKWKPPEFNTIDFMVNTVRKNGVDEVFYKDGVVPYKKLILRCGFDVDNAKFYTNAFQNMLRDALPQDEETDFQNSRYRPIRFVPTDPYYAQAYFCSVADPMTTAEGEPIQDNTIIEFAYDLTDTADDKSWRWKPLRIRHDKTAQLRTTFDNFGNAYPVANNVWYSINNPIPQTMLTTGEGIPALADDSQDVYYNRKQGNVETTTKPLRDFHNRFVKQKLIYTASAAARVVANSRKTLIDFAVGKAGDLQKWTAPIHGVDFVFGVDVSKDNIMNAMDGACQRLLQFRLRQPHSRFRACFVPGNSGLNLRNGEAFGGADTEYGQIARAIFGDGRTDHRLTEKYHGIGKEGFHVGSCQFALHYFFRDGEILHQFLQNVCENVRPDGLFIGTCYDGESVFEMLTKRAAITITRPNSVSPREPLLVFEIEKNYAATNFEADATSLGYTIRVFQESIGQKIDEYLVHFGYFRTVMAHYGFELLGDEDAQKYGLPGGTGLFRDLFTQMLATEKTTNERFGQAAQMSENEKQISFLNRYFIFRRERVVSGADVSRRLRASASVIAPAVAAPVAETPTSTPKKRAVRKIKETVVLGGPTSALASTRPRVAVIVPFRDPDGDSGPRSQQLAAFLKHMQGFFSPGEAEIFVIQQNDDGRKFNRGLLLNIGFLIAEKAGFQNYVFHDVDLLPSPELKQYYLQSAAKAPVHTANVWGRYNKNPKYLGGVVSFSGPMFREANGFPNNYWGWGGEDDEMYSRVMELRPKPRIVKVVEGQYTDLEGMDIGEKMVALKKNKEKMQVVWELNAEHKDTWKNNGVSQIANVDAVVEKQEACGENCVRVLVNLPLFGHWSDEYSGVDDLRQPGAEIRVAAPAPIRVKKVLQPKRKPGDA